MNKPIELDVLKSEAFKKALQKRCALLYVKLGKFIDTKCGGDVSRFKKALALLRQYSARANKAKDLDKEEQAKYAKLKALFRKSLEVGIVTFTIRLDGKVKKVSFKTVSHAMLDYGIRIIKHGKQFAKNEHWKNFFLPVEDKIDAIYKMYKKTVKQE